MLEAADPRQRWYTGNSNIVENWPRDHGGVVTLKFLGFATSSRDTFNKPYSNNGGYCDQDKSSNYIISISKINVEHLNIYIVGVQFVKRPPRGDIALQDKHSTIRMKWSVGAPQSIEIAPAIKFVILEDSDPAIVNILEKFIIFEIWPYDHGCVFTYN